MFHDSHGDGVKAVNLDAIKSEVRAAIINQKVNACPITMRHAWHMAGTFDKSNGTGGTNGATIRFAPESTDGANNGLHIIRDLLEPVKKRHPEISYADLYVLASAMAIEFAGGPQIPVRLGRGDDNDGRRCPANGRLPDATQGAAHLRDVFGRMGFNDQEIVALSGAHTLGSCHRVRSGFDGQWTSKPLAFDNEYFVNLITKQWRPREWEGPRQFQDESGKLMMLPTDLALIEDPGFRKYVEAYARDGALFNKDFAAAYGKLMALGCPAHVQPTTAPPQPSAQEEQNRLFRHFAMHGSVEPLKQQQGKADIHSVDPASGRSALHFSAFWGHVAMTKYLTGTLKLNVNATDFNGDTPLHDAAAHGHEEVCKILLEAGANPLRINRDGLDPLTTAREANYLPVAEILLKAVNSGSAPAASGAVGKGKLSTHVLDTANGCPAANLRIELFKVDPATGQMNLLMTARTNQDGRTDKPLYAPGTLIAGTFQLKFYVAEYFAARGNIPKEAAQNGQSFLTIVPVTFTVVNPDEGFHVPLVCSPWSYSTYRGS